MQYWPVFGKTEILTSDGTVHWYYFGKQSTCTCKNLTFAYSCPVISILDLSPKEKLLAMHKHKDVCYSTACSSKKLEHLVSQYQTTK